MVKVEALRFSVGHVVKELKTVLRSRLKIVGRAVIFPKRKNNFFGVSSRKFVLYFAVALSESTSDIL
jgi:hypothetical protein